MNHVITIGDVLGFLGIGALIVGALIILVAVLYFFAQGFRH